MLHTSASGFYYQTAGASNGLLNNLYAHYTFAGDSTDDHTGSHDMTSTNVTYNTGANTLDNYAIYNGTNAYTQMVDLDSITNYNADWSINFWFRAPNTAQRLWGGSEGGSGNIQHMVITNVVKISNNADSSADYLVSFTGPSANNWHMMTILWDSAGTLEIYIDNSSVGSDSSGTLADFYTQYVPTIGALNNVGSIIQYTQEDIALFGIWQKTLTTTDIDTLYASGSGLAYSSFTS